MSKAKILVTGGAGYIGSHTCVELLNDDYEIIVLDNLSNSSEESLKRVQQITGKTLEFVEVDIRDRALLDKLFSENTIQAVIHFAGLKAVGESVEIPLSYYDNNVTGTLVMLEAFEKASEKPVPYKFAPRRSGDIAACYANPDKALKELGWKAEKGLTDMVTDGWRWQSQSPDGYQQ